MWWLELINLVILLLVMTERIGRFLGAQLAEIGLKPTRLVDDLLLADDPTLHRYIKQRIRRKITKSGKPPEPQKVDEVLSDQMNAFLTEEVILQEIDFPIASEKLNKHVFEKILQHIIHLDFRDFETAQHGEFSLYDPEVITPQVSWAVEQIFQNLPGFFNFLDELVQHNLFLEADRTDLVRNIFIAGYLHGFFSDSNPNVDITKLLLARSIKQSYRSTDKLKSYPDFLIKLIEKDKNALVSPRLKHLKNHWHQQLAQRWLMLARVDEASASALSQSTQQQVEKSLPKDTRLVENVGVARKIDRLFDLKTVFRGEKLDHGSAEYGSMEGSQVRAELQLAKEVAEQRIAAILHMRDILRLYQGTRREVFHDGHQVTEKWASYKAAAELILQKLVTGFASLTEAQNDDAIYDQAMDEIVQSMIQSLVDTSSGTPKLLEEMFGKDFFGLAKIEQLCLMAFTALSFVTRETSTSKLAVQILDQSVIPRLNEHFDLDNSLKLSSNNVAPFGLAAYDEQVFTVKSKEAKKVLHNLQPDDGLVSIDNEYFLQIAKEKQKLLSAVAKVYSFFASLTTENFGEYANLKTPILGIFFAVTAFISGYFNFNISQDLLTESLHNIWSEDPYVFLLKIAPTFLTLTSGAFLMGAKARKEFKQLLLSSSELKKDLKKFSKGGWRQGALILFLSVYAGFSTFPQWQDKAEDWWDSAKEYLEEVFDGEPEPAGGSLESIESFWENRNPEAIDVNDLKDIEKVDWGEIVIGEDVYGQGYTAPIGFINTYVVSPVVTDSEHQAFNTEVSSLSSENITFAENVLVNASSYVVRGNEIVFTLVNGETYIQPAAGVDFVAKNGLANSENGFASLLDTGSYIDKIILIVKPGQTSGFFPNQEIFRSYNHPDQYFDSLLWEQHDFFVVYKTDLVDTNEMNTTSINFADSFAFWQSYAEERQIVQEVLERENPEAAELYAQMVLEQNLFWEDFDLQADNTNLKDNYLKMLKKQLGDYYTFVHTNHVYSLQYDPQTDYVTQYPKVGVLLDVMALKKGGYYCQTAHLAAQEWFLSLGVPLEGLYGYAVYDDGGTARSRIGHVQSGIYHAVYDFTPSIPNPGEDLSALAFDENMNSAGLANFQEMSDEQAAALELLRKIATAENISSLILILCLVGVGYSIKSAIDQMRKKPTHNNDVTLEQVRRILPDNELALRGLTSALLHVFTILPELEQLFPDINNQAGNSSQVISQLVKESLSLAIAPTRVQAETILNTSRNPEITALLQLTKVHTNPVDEDTSQQVEELWQRLSKNRELTTKFLEEAVKQLDGLSADFKKTGETTIKSTSQSIRKLKKQLMRMRKKENRMYGLYGKFLETTNLVESRKINEARLSITASYITIQHEIEKKEKELAQLNTQAKLLPQNAKNLKKVLNFVLSSVKERSIDHA